MEFEITEDSINGPYFGIVYGPAGTGKTWLCKYAEKPFYVAVEKGVEKVKGVGKFIKDGAVNIPENIDEFYKMLQYFVKNDTPYKTIIIDSGMFVDKLKIEKIIADQPTISKKGESIKVDSISDYTYGKGYSKLVSMWETRFFTALKYMHKKGLNVIIIAHSRAKNVTDAEGNDYKKHGIDMAEFGIYSVPNLLSAKADFVLFMRNEPATKKKLNAYNEVKHVADNSQQQQLTVYTRGTQLFDAKVRTEIVDNVADEYIIDIRDESTSKKLFEDLIK